MLSENLLSVIEILGKAGDAIRETYVKDDFQTEIKSDNSPVTIADKMSSEIINEGLTKLFPKTPILNEEKQITPFEERKNWSKYFLVDPLDGTKEFINRNGEFCINVALIDKNRPAEGIIYQPLEKKGWFCQKGKGIQEFDLSGQMRSLSICANKINTLRVVTSRSFFKPLEQKMIQDLKEHYSVEIIHRGSSLKQIDIILGQADMYLKAGPCSEWDTAPGQLMIEEFGGKVLRLQDFEPLEYNKDDLRNPYFVMLNSQLCNNGFIHKMRYIAHNNR